MASLTQRVLVVDDDADARDSLADYLETIGYSVQTASNGAEALSYLESAPPPVVILLDLTMPVMDGFRFRAAQLKKPAIADVPVIVITAEGARADPDGSMQGVSFLRKPIQHGRLVEEIGKVAGVRLMF
jgi:CheY-like chemotaxis protein